MMYLFNNLPYYKETIINYDLSFGPLSILITLPCINDNFKCHSKLKFEINVGLLCVWMCVLLLMFCLDIVYVFEK